LFTSLEDYTVNARSTLPEAAVPVHAAFHPKCHRASFQTPDRVSSLSFINDLSAIITAGDPSERRAELFGVDSGRKRCEVVGFRNSAGSNQKRR
jgi:hypothetical protein